MPGTRANAKARPGRMREDLDAARARSEFFARWRSMRLV
jgi:hypothetical protein